MNNIHMQVATVVRELCGGKGLSMNGLSRESGIPYPSLRKYFLAGETEPRLEVLQKVGSVFGMTVSELFERAERTTPEPWPSVSGARKGVVAKTGRKGKGGNGTGTSGGGSDDSPSPPLTLV